METPTDPLDIARARIAEEAERKTGALDLGGLGLSELPPEISGLGHLVQLNLGGWPWLEDSTPNFSGRRNQANSITDLSPLRQLLALQMLDCSTNSVTDLAPLAGLTALQALDCSLTSVTDLAPLAGLTALQTLHCSQTSVSDLAPLAGLTALQTLHCSQTSVMDLAPLAGLTALQTLNCWHTSVTDLVPLAGLAALQTLNCWHTSVTELVPLAGLTALKTLGCSATSVIDLAPLAGLTALQTLNCSATSVADLAPLAGLTALQTLNCSGTSVTDLAPLAGLTALQTLNCSGTSVTELAPLAGLAALQSLDCSATPITDLAPLIRLQSLLELRASGCMLESTPPQLLRHPTLKHLFLESAALRGIPTELLSSRWDDNCLPRLRAHLDDLEAGAAPITDIKLMVLGNGRAGKTQLVRRLCGPAFPYQPEWNSTHGVQIATAALRREATDEPTRVHLWDFGGQDIYHGTHTLFTQARAVFVIVWANDTEATAEYERDGIRFRNHPLQYWVHYVGNNGGADCPLLIVQAKCDTPADERRRLPLDDALLDALPYVKTLHYSASNNRGRAALDEALAEASDWLHAPERSGAPLIGRVRLAVQRRLEALREADLARPPSERQHRTLSQDFFRAICDEAGGIRDPSLFLEYLNSCGVVFYRPGLFGDAIVLDQAWALDAIYAVFQREKCYRHLRATGGRFTRLLLDAMVWSAFAPEEQHLFLSMMRSSGICFPHRRGASHDDDETEYIAPDLLPERATVQTAIDALWDESAAVERALYAYTFEHPGLIRALIARIGNEAGINAVYWKGGVALYEVSTQSRACLDYQIGADWSASLCLRTQAGRATDLLKRLCEWVEAAQTALGIAPAEAPQHRDWPQPKHGRSPVEPPEAEEQAKPPLVFAAPPRAEPAWYVSYAWGDSSAEGREREVIVDQLCTRAAASGRVIQRDRSVLRTGDSISKFMQQIGRGDRVFVVLSEKYLHSPFCMFELFAIWSSCGQDSEGFSKTVRIYALPDAAIFTPLDRIKIAIHWKTQHAALDTAIREHGADVVGVSDFQQYKLMSEFAGRVADVLAVIADRVLPRTFEQLAEYGFADAP